MAVLCGSSGRFTFFFGVFFGPGSPGQVEQDASARGARDGRGGGGSADGLSISRCPTSMSLKGLKCQCLNLSIVTRAYVPRQVGAAKLDANVYDRSGKSLLLAALENGALDAANSLLCVYRSTPLVLSSLLAR